MAVYLKPIMRVVYDYGFGKHSASTSATGPMPGKETVLVVSVRPEKDGNDGARAPSGAFKPDEVRVSDEALARSREVEAHENAHIAMLGGAAASPVMYDTVRGPNGEAIKVGGSVKVDMAEVPGDPEATLRKANAIIAAANAPNDPSAADARTAARAYQMASKAQEEIAAERSPSVDLKA